MANALIIFGSTTGNTETTAERIGNILSDSNFKVTIQEVSETSLGDEAGYDFVLYGCSTWGEEEIELQDDFIDYYEAMEKAPLSGKKVGVFGCGDTSYTYFCGAVDVIEEKVKTAGGELVVDGLKIDGDPEDADDEIVSWAKEVVSAA